MTCTNALELMLDADPGELAARDDSPLAGHLRECARCGAVARQLLADTGALAVAVAGGRIAPARARAAGRIRARAPMLAGLAAAAIGIVVWQGSRSTPAPMDAPTVVARVTAPSPAAPSPAAPSPAVPAASVPVRPRIASGVATRPSSVRAPSAPRAFEPAREFVATAVAPARFMPPPAQVARTAAIAVEPAAGTRAAVIRTSDPTVTVLWFY
jgi:hypothetical protein